MKKTVTTIATAWIMIVSFSSFATEKTNPLKNMESAKVLTSYLEATTLGNAVLNEFLFTDDFEYRNMANNDSYDKTKYIDFLKGQQGVQLDCETTYEILDQSGNTCIAKTTLKFKTFTRVDHITMSQTEDGWKVSSVRTTYPGI